MYPRRLLYRNCIDYLKQKGFILIIPIKPKPIG
nr:MAG TPA: hypothetical protein [Caudoviricetes sp.]